MTTIYHAKYLARELTRRCPSDLQKLAATLAVAQVDLNPHQIDAALFAFRSPLSKGAILADQVGLGKTIEAGILLSQKWAEQKRKLLIIVPAALRNQWNQELADKFFLSSVIAEARSFNQFIKQGNLNPFNQKEIVICSYHFARAKGIYIKQVNWDLVVADEAHRLRTVFALRSMRLKESPWIGNVLGVVGLLTFIYTFCCSYGIYLEIELHNKKSPSEDELCDTKELISLEAMRYCATAR
jgi:SNF2 family DNA or RNA helicase